jgi:hypothetical protein
MSGSDLDYEVRNQMRPADVFVIIAGMYVAHSGWIDFELAFARGAVVNACHWLFSAQLLM